jgi:hypothetical protein
MGKGNLGRREGSGHHLGLLSTGVGEFSIKLTLDYSQTILLSLSVSYDGDDQSRCHEEENQVTNTNVAERQTCPTRPTR